MNNRIKTNILLNFSFFPLITIIVFLAKAITLVIQPLFTLKKGTDLLIPISAKDGKRLGYHYLKHLRDESDFVKLILKYIFDESVEKFWILTNRESNSAA